MGTFLISQCLARNQECPHFSVLAVGLLFDDRRAELVVDAALELRTLVILHVDRPRELDEARIETACPLLVPDVVFDHPQPRVDGFEGGGLRRYVPGRACVSVWRSAPGPLEHIELVAYVRELRGVFHTRSLDPEDRDLVEEFAG